MNKILFSLVRGLKPLAIELSLTLLMTIYGNISMAQRVYFIYIQTENQQSFFVNLNEKVYNSTASGYLILSKLRDSTYQLVLNFPENKWPEQKFSIIINKKDHGYLLKNFGDKGWGLYDFQTLSVQMSAAIPIDSDRGFAVSKTSIDPFTSMLSKAADDPSLLQRPVIAKLHEKKNETISQPVVKKEVVDEQKNKISSEENIDIVLKPETMSEKTEKPKNENPVVITARPEELKNKDDVESKKPENKEENKFIENKSRHTEPGNVIFQKSNVTKKSESSTTEGFGLVFIDEYLDGSKDTIRVLIPNDQKNISQAEGNMEPKEEKKFLELNNDKKNSKDSIKQVKKPGKLISIFLNKKDNDKNEKSLCQQIAGESDFFKIRKKMASEKNENDMIIQAKKYFKVKCFTTEQIKNLSTLFLTNNGKYKFFDAAHTYVSDKEKFPSLESELKDEYFIKRFKGLTY